MDWPLNWLKAYDELGVVGQYRVEPEDFCVTEIAGFEHAGEGEHLYLYVEKKNTNTQWLARQIADQVGVPLANVSYAGLKDRRAVTRQWFSIYWGLKKPEPSFAGLEKETGAKVLEVTRHTKKLRRGQLQANAFEIRLRGLGIDVDHSNALSLAERLDQRLSVIAESGVPNYFGEQRFGFDGHNVAHALEIFQRKRRERNRQKFSLYLSAARSYLFNWLCQERVRQGILQQCIEGDLVEENDPKLLTGPMWGRGRLPTAGLALELESQLAEVFPDICNGLEHAGLSQERRKLTNQVQDLTWEWQEDELLLRFKLSPGSYATAVLRELGSIEEFRPSVEEHTDES